MQVKDLAKNIILNTKIPVRALAGFLNSLPQSYGLTAEGVVFGLFMYLADEENAHEYTLEYLSELREEMKTSTRDPVKIDQLIDTYMYEVARAMWEEMVTWKVYTQSGTCWYYPNRLINFDLVLELTSELESVADDLSDIQDLKDEEALLQ